jgi:hypothetical protein
MSRASRVRGTLDIEFLSSLEKGVNETEVTMSDSAAKTRLVAHEKALEAAGIAISCVLRVPAPLKSIADQVVRSASYWRAGRAVTHHRQRAGDG